MSKPLYFAYGSNMNLDQMAQRCPSAELVGNATLDGYALAFRGSPGTGYATILPKPGSRVQGVLWRVTERDRQRLDTYEGWPRHYKREYLLAKDSKGREQRIMAYTMNSPDKDEPALPSRYYLDGILQGCRQNKIPAEPVLKAAEQVAHESRLRAKPRKNLER